MIIGVAEVDTSVGFLQPWVEKISPWISYWLYIDSTWWTAIGLLGNLTFASRFVVQWLYSERAKRVVVPPMFWYLSFFGGCVMFVYALHVDKAPIIFGALPLPFIYARNLILMKRSVANEEKP